MKKILLLFYSLLFCSIVEAQNLVPNYSFEDTVACPSNLDQVNKAVGWSSFCQSPDYFNICSSSQFVSVPNTNFGYQYPRSGNGFVGMHCYLGGGYREIVGIQLSSPLIIGEKYYASFYTVRALGGISFISTAINRIGLKLSTMSYSFSNPIAIDNSAQIYSDSVISDTLNWTRVSGSFIADSSYEYLSLGNFFDNANTTVINYDSTTGYAYYFIDDIFLSTDSTIGVPEIPNHNPQIQIFPNPFHSTFTLHCPQSIVNSQLSIYNCIGEKIFSTYIKSEEQSIELNVSAGVYLLRVGDVVQKLIVY